MIALAKSFHRMLAGSAIMIAAILSGCVTERSPITGERRAYGYSWEQEVQLGAEADQQITQQFGIYQDGELQTYINELGQEVLQHSHMRRADAPLEYQQAPFTFRVLNSPVVNAFALPGGYVYITRGLLAHVQNEAQLVVVLGHEIAHVAARHASRQALRAKAGQIGLIAGAIVGAQVFDSGAVARNILQTGGQVFQLLLLRYSRDAEREADLYGVEYAISDGYQASEASGFFNSLDRIRQQQGATLPQWQSTHPDPGEREERIVELAQEFDESRAEKEVGKERYMRAIDNLIIGLDPREGYKHEGVFYHPELRFQFQPPPNWQVQNERAIVIMQPPDGGRLMTLEIIQASNARQAATTFVSQQKIQAAEMENINLNSLSAVRLLGQVTSEQNQLGLLGYFIEYEGKIYSILGVAPAAAFQKSIQTFSSTAESFQSLTDPERINVEPARLAIVEAPGDAAFRSFLPGKLPYDITAEDIAVMNQLQLDDVVEAGTLLKLPANLQ